MKIRKALLGGSLLVCSFLAARAQVVLDPTLSVTPFVGGLSQPTSMAFLSSKEVLVLQKANGQVRLIVQGVLQAAPVLDVAVNASSERGLLGIAVDPQHIFNGFVYLYYTEAAADGAAAIANRIYRYRWDGANLVEPLLILDLPVTPGPNHDGGAMVFGPDGKLYMIMGELNRNGQLQNFPLGPVPDDTGVIFRINTDGSGPPDNPFYVEDAPGFPMNRYYAYGIRNSFGLAFDPLTGQLWQTENGPANMDEINLTYPGWNSGWEQIMGPDSRDPQGVADLWMQHGASYSDPEFSWAATVAPTGITFAASPRLGCGLQNDILVGDNNCGQLYHFELKPDRQSLSFTSVGLQDLVADNVGGTCSLEQGEILFGSGFGIITDLENGPDGSLYVVSISTGNIYRIGRNPGSVPDIDGDDVADDCDCALGDPSAYALPVEVPRLRLSGTNPWIVWDTQAPQAGGGTTYAIVTGDLAALRADGGFASACVIGSGSAAPAYIDQRVDPAEGAGYYYLVRAGNACAQATFGDGSENPDPRDLLDAALPLACP